MTKKTEIIWMKLWWELATGTQWLGDVNMTKTAAKQKGLDQN